MPNVMAALPNTRGAVCATPKSLANAHYKRPCSNAAKTRNPLKFDGVLQTRQHSACTESRRSAADGRPWHLRSVHRDGATTAMVDAVYTTPLLRRTGIIYTCINGISHFPGPKWRLKLLPVPVLTAFFDSPYPVSY